MKNHSEALYDNVPGVDVIPESADIIPDPIADFRSRNGFTETETGSLSFDTPLGVRVDFSQKPTDQAQ